MSRRRKWTQGTSGQSGSRSLSPGPRPLRTGHESFLHPALPISEDPKAGFGLSIRRATVSASSDPTVRTVCAMAFPSSRPPRPVGSQHPFQVGSLLHPRGPIPPITESLASSHVLCPLGIGRLCSRLSQFTVFRQQEMQTPGPLCPGGGLSCRGADSDRHILSTYLLVRADQPLCSFDFTRFAGVHHVTHRVFPLARYPGAAPRHRYFSACCTPLRYQRRMTPMRRGRQDRLGPCDHSADDFTSHL